MASRRNRRPILPGEGYSNLDEESDGGENHTNEISDIRGDEWNVATLFFLYLLQGIPLGLSSAIPMYLQSKSATYSDQAQFSFVHWPFSLKLLWAPIVDSMYSSRMGRRKSWLIPSQYLIGFFMLFLSRNVENWLGGDVHSADIKYITLCFFFLNFLAATQDIAVDGWALTMLKRCNVGHASTCNSVGQTAGYFLGYVVFMGLDSAGFCNKYLRSIPQPYGLVSLSGFLYFWGLVFLATTTILCLFKRETTTSFPTGQTEPELGVKQTYLLLWDILKLPTMQTTIMILLTSKIAYSACDAVTGLKLVEMGVPKEKFAGLAVPIVPLQIILPLIISRFLLGPRPMDLYLKAVPYRLWSSLFAVALVWWAPYNVTNNEISTIYYICLLLGYALIQVAVYTMFVSVMAFFARISDPAVGGTYMTLLNTVSNLGGNWPSTVALWLVDPLTVRSCTASTLTQVTCSNAEEIAECIKQGGTCKTVLDGYYIECVVCFVLGWIWLFLAKKKIQYLQSRRDVEWKAVRRRVDNNIPS